MVVSPFLAPLPPLRERKEGGVVVVGSGIDGIGVVGVVVLAFVVGVGVCCCYFSAVKQYFRHLMMLLPR